MATFGIIKRDDSHTLHGVLMLLDDRTEADEIARELNRKGLGVDVRELSDVRTRWRYRT